MKNLNCILLVDDDEPTNFLHKMAIEEAGVCDNLVSVKSGHEALNYFERPESLTPDIIFLDINMPKMNGWQFLEQYKKIDEEKKAKIIIVMLTTSLNPRDKEKANSISEIKDFRTKPLTPNMLADIVRQHFPEATTVLKS